MAEQANSSDERSSRTQSHDHHAPGLGEGGAEDPMTALDARSAALDEVALDLTCCGSCDCELMHPVGSGRVAARHWRVELRCPNCEERGTVVVEEGVVDRLGSLLEHGVAEIALALCDAVEERVAREVGDWVLRLEDDDVLPEHF